MSTVTFDKLYDNYNVLSDAKERISERSQEYLEAIEATKGTEKEKKLATQIISTFFKHFPELQNRALDAIFDLCEDDDSSIRIAAMKSLPSLCKDSKDALVKIADILAQLLQLEDPQEYNAASSGLLQILKMSPTLVIKRIFNQIHSPENLLREKAIKFLVAKIKTSDKSILTPEVEDIMITEIKKTFQDATAEEFVALMPFLMCSRLSHTPLGQQELIEIISSQAEINEAFNPLDKESNNVDRLVTCLKIVLPLFSAKVESTKFVEYICNQVLPQWDNIASVDRGDLFQILLLKQLAELSTNCGKMDEPVQHVKNVFDRLLDYMPPPPDDADMKTIPSLNFTAVECLLYAFHKLARQCPGFLTDDPQRLKDFRARLTYFSRGVQSCSKALSDGKDRQNLSEEDMRKKRMSPKLLNNINTLIRDLFYKPPKYQCSIVLSFKAEEALSVQENQTSGVKRHIPITFEENGTNSNGSKQSRSSKASESMKLYTPPSGKFSNTFQNYGSRSRGRSIKGGVGRGRSSIRSWRN